MEQRSEQARPSWSSLKDTQCRKAFNCAYREAKGRVEAPEDWEELGDDLDSISKRAGNITLNPRSGVQDLYDIPEKIAGSRPAHPRAKSTQGSRFRSQK